jgi:hypothetical protein
MLRPMPKPLGKTFGAPRLARLAVLAAVLAAPLLASGRAHAGVTLVMQRGNDPTSTLYLDGDKMRAENAKTSGEHTVIIDAANKKMMTINDAEKTYMEITQADMERMAGFIASQRAAMEERMKSMPPEQRKKMEEMMGGQMMGGAAKPHDFKFEKMGGKKTVSGFSCEMYRISEDGKPKDEVCLAPWSPSFITRADFGGLIKFSQEMQKSLGNLAGGNRHPFDQFDKAPGFPVLRHPLEPGQEDEVLKSLKRGSIPASTFAVPAGYTKKEMPMGPMMGGRPHGMGGKPVPPQ